MHSGMIGKIEKARRYAEERSRFDIEELAVTVKGNNGDHRVTFDGALRCECDFFQHQRTCAHTMAIEMLLSGMLSRQSAAA